VRAQVDRDLTTVDYFDRLLGLIKNLGRHSSSFERKVAIDFPDLHAMFRCEKLDINLVTIWSM
jgi:hypothetical protein